MTLALFATLLWHTLAIAGAGVGAATGFLLLCDVVSPPTPCSRRRVNVKA